MSSTKNLAGVIAAAALVWLKANTAVLGGFARAVLAAAGGWLVSEGYMSAGDVESLSGNVPAMIGSGLFVSTVVWSLVSKLRKGGAAEKAKEGV